MKDHKKKYIIWGASNAGKLALSLYSSQINILGFTDSDVKKHGGKFCELEVFSPPLTFDIIEKNENVNIVIASMYAEEIIEKLFEVGISREKIFTFSCNYRISPLIAEDDKFSAAIYLNKLGVKAENQIFKRVYLPQKNVTTLSLDKLRLGIDWLRNDYTLIGTEIMDSPHFGLMQAISDNKDTRALEYIYRKEKGTLDFREGSLVTEKFLEDSEFCFKKRKQEILSQTYDPIKVVNFDEKFYIVDGKHRAALACLLKMNEIKIIDATLAWNDSYYHWIYDFIRKNSDFSLHISVYEEYLNLLF